MAFAFLKKLKDGLLKTRKSIADGFKKVLSVGRRLDARSAEELEEVLISADIGVKLATELSSKAEMAYRQREVKRPEDLADFVRHEISRMLPERECAEVTAAAGPTVVLVIGVNGSGKTTTCAKLAKRHKDAGRKVILAAADTFRAAATEQLCTWAERIGVQAVRGGEGADPAAVAFDAAEAAVARKMDVLIVDTAGRLHTKENLMRELEKIGRVVGRKIPGAPHEILLVLDATTGQNALSQAKLFTEGVGVTGLVLAKLDGTAKGGVVLGIWNEVKIPVKFIGLGEGFNDLAPFSAPEFVDAIFNIAGEGEEEPDA
ncbi:MAG: signal recognition particle-docking protein FtsY [Planctomycetota bacterium]|jgi:fused signal recognition particle receptor